MLFCPVPWFADPAEEEYSASKNKNIIDTNDNLQTPLAKQNQTALTPATESSTPGDSSTVASTSSFDDEINESEESNSTAPICPKALVFEDPSTTVAEPIEEEKVTTTQELPKAIANTPEDVAVAVDVVEEAETEEEKNEISMISPLTFLLFAIVIAFLGKSRSMFPKQVIAVQSQNTVETPTIENAIDIEEPTNIDIDLDLLVDLGIEEADAIE